MFKSIFTLLLLIALGITVFLGAKWSQFLKTPINQSPDTFVLVVKPGTSMSHIARTLQQDQRIGRADFLILLTYLKGAARQIKTGHYAVKPGTTPSELIDKLVKGDIILEKLTIVDGWTFKQLRQAINDNPYIKHTVANLSPAQLMKKLGSQNTSPEGLFLPETYLFSIETEDVEILKRAYDAMQKLIEQEWERRDLQVAYKNAYEALIAASLIQKETHLVEEYARVSAVINNRLKKGMLLQIDPSVIYGLNDKYQGTLLLKQLKMDTPYNTYTRLGLPPTPIALVNPQALYAALHPAAENLLYFVADGSGGHIFSASLKDHVRAVIEFRKKQTIMHLQEKQRQENPTKKHE